MRTRALWALSISFLLLGFHCGEPAAEPTAPRALAKPTLRLLVLTDPRGYLEPCGCQQRPLGGVDRLATILKQIRADGVPSLLLAAGDLTHGGHLNDEDRSAAAKQEAWRAETLIDIWSRLGLAGATPGPLDFAAGREAAAALIARSKFPWIVDNVSPSPAAEPLRRAQLLQAGNIKVGVIGLLTDAAGESLPAELAVDREVRAAAERAARELREQGAALVVAMTVGDRRVARSAAAPGVDVVVMAGLNQETPLPPVIAGETAIVHGGREGQRLLVIDLNLSAQGPWHDASAWTQEVERRAAEEQVRDLKTKIAGWEKDPQINTHDLEGQRARLRGLEQALKNPVQPSFAGRWLNARVIDLDPDVPEDKGIEAVMKAFDKRVNEHNKVALAHLVPKPAPEGAPRYVGSEPCRACHEAAYSWWRSTKHGQAYATLENVDKEFNLACVSCHVTGYNQPGGSTVTHVAGLKDVGCENCHGPASRHIDKPEEPALIQRDSAEAVCLSCHNRDHSARFVYEGFKAMLLAPGHGLPVK